MERPSPRFIITERESSISKYAEKQDGYISFRGLFDKKTVNPKNNESFIVPGYINVLPKYKEQNLIEIVDKKIEEGRLVTMLDVGTGSGKFLIQSRTRWGSSVDLKGITSFPHHKRKSTTGLQRISKKATFPELEKQNIQIIEGDAQSLFRTLKDNGISIGFDVVTSVYCVDYCADPFSSLKQMHKILNPEGVGLIKGDIFKKLNEEDKIAFQNYLRDVYEMEVSDDSISFSKQNPKLCLPIEYRIGESGNLRYGYA